MGNVYIKRQGENITGLFSRPQYDGQECLPETDAEVVSFSAKQNKPSTKEEIYNKTLQNSDLIKAMALALNEVGSFTPDHSKLANSELKSLIISYM